MKKICILGHFAFGTNAANGQTIKTKIVTEALERRFSENMVMKIDTYGGIKSLIKAPFQVIKALKKAENVIMFPAHNGVRVFGRLLPFFKYFFDNKKIHYVVIGGWLPQFLKRRRGLAKALKRFDGIYVETNTMQKALESQNFTNVSTFPNFKQLKVLGENELIYLSGEPYRLCTFSRVLKEKGIEDAINAIKRINGNLNRTAFTLDIYGPVDSRQIDWFNSIQDDFPDYVQYKGIVPFDKSTDVLKNYFALLFPTHYYTEGIPGTIIDAYASGIPVVSAKWESFSDIVDEGKTGLGYEFDNYEDFVQLLYDLVENPQILNNMKPRCLKKADDFMPNTVVAKIVEYLE